MTELPSRLRIDVVFPHEIEIARGDELREFFSAVEKIGADAVMVFDHVAGAPLETLQHLPVVPYTDASPFYEALVLLGYAAAATSDLELVTGVLVLPQRQTLLAAKQLATIDLLSDERLRVGLGVGWNSSEYAAMGARFDVRGDVLDEQVALLRGVWDGDVVTANERFHEWPPIGIAPPPRRQIPIWFGGTSERALHRVATQGDGWIPPMMDSTGDAPDVSRLLLTLEEKVVRVGRDRASIGVEGRAVWTGNATLLRDSVDQWRQLGADRVAITLRLDDDRTSSRYLAALEAAVEALA